ncbi:UNVERIFIED_CONTAM: protein OCTOPUS [Sesamum radiatum]|uniref:Protein OCTOPUS n=1 Tax=Sesamum radiatum TaxID=300843 RepID=A0AAW2NNJ3_SESRA
MNPTSADPTAPPPQPPQPPRSSFSCDRHPHEHFTGFCPSCLCERLTTLDHSSSNTPSSSRRPSSASAAAAAAIKSLFSSTSKPNNFPLHHHFPNPPNPLLFSPNYVPVFEETENEEDFRDPEYVEDDIVVYGDDDDGEGGEIRPVRDSHLVNLRNAVEVEVNSGEIVVEELVSVSSLKPMKDHIDLDAQDKKSSGGGFWAAASVFSKKWQKWRRKQKMKKQNNGDKFAALPVEKPLSRQYRETQSEIADYGFGRRSCDTDPRFSLDAGRISFDDPRYSFDEPRASWDGYLIGRSFPRMAPMVSVMEDAPAVQISRSDMQIPVEEPTSNCDNEGEGVPGGTTQTREYYSDSSSRRRKSLDRSSSIRKTAAAVVAEIDD